MTSHPPDQETGFSRRKILLTTLDAQTVTAWLEDDFHHFGICLTHDGKRVVAVKALAQRFPYTSCAGAVSVIKAVNGAKIFARASDIGRVIDMRRHCTHLFDLTGLAIAHVFAGRTQRLYEAIVTDRDILAMDAGGRRTLGRGCATLWRDSRRVLAWSIDGQAITAPSPISGQSLAAGFRAWTEAMAVEEAEYATVLRRAIMIAGGRNIDRTDYPLPGQRDDAPVCYTFQKSVRDTARWIDESVTSWEENDDEMLSLAGKGKAIFERDGAR